MVRKVKFPPKHLHAQEWENDDEEEEKKEQGGDGAHRIEERGNKITQRGPVPAKQLLEERYLIILNYTTNLVQHDPFEEDMTYFVTLRILSSRMHLSTEKPRGATAPAENMIISRIPHSTTKKSKRLNNDMKYPLGPSAYIFTNISMTNSTSSARLATSVEIRDERRQMGDAGSHSIYVKNTHDNILTY